jgi:hypothetical protein
MDKSKQRFIQGIDPFQQIHDNRNFKVIMAAAITQANRLRH